MSERFVIPTPTSGPFKLGPDSQRHRGVPQGSVTQHKWRSEIFPGTVRDYFVYVPAQYTRDEPASLMVFQDGARYADVEGPVRAPIVFDNLIHQGKMPVTIGIFINPGIFPPTAPDREPVSNRSVEYDTLSDQYACFLLEEILPVVGAKYRLTDAPEQRAICGMSSGGICAWTVAWQQPDAFRKVLSHVGSFTDIRGGHIYPFLIRQSEPKPIRVFLQAGSNDLDRPAGDWPLANLQMGAAFHSTGYDFRLVFGDGAHNFEHGASILPESLAWLWR